MVAGLKQSDRRLGAHRAPRVRQNRPERGRPEARPLRFPAPASLVRRKDEPRASHPLRRALVALDASCVALGWLVALLLPDDVAHLSWDRVLRLGVAVPLVTAGSVALIAANRLYRARVASVRAVETQRLFQVAAVGGLFMAALAHFVHLDASPVELGAGTVITLVLLSTERDVFRVWLKAHRRQGRFRRPVVVVGSDAEGVDLCQLVEDHPELGFEVSGVVGSRREVEAAAFGVPWLGESDQAVEAVRRSGATGAFVAASAVPPAQLNRLVRDLLAAGVHVHLSSGLRGINYRRVRAQPLAGEPMFYLEPLKLSQWQLVVKRALDVVLASVALLAVAPVLELAAAAIKLNDGGPVLFRQRRVGRDGTTFPILKFRTMVVAAEAQLEAIAAANQRKGPLFKLAGDPRITKVGRILRATSIDELPQLLNVLQGTMSLVGPRPALPDEVARFDEELMARQAVRPGITGLWQIEARDNPSFAAYKRFDLFYVENWSVGLDLAILLTTVQTVALRAVHSLSRSGKRAPTAA